MSQHGFKRLSTVATWANSLAFVLTSSIAASESLPPVPAPYQSSASCDQGTPGGEFVVGGYKYRLSHEIFPPSMDLSHKIQEIYGRDTELADWDDLKSKLNDVKTRHDFVRAIGMPLQSQNFECGNALITKGGSGKLNGMNYFVARHDGARLKNWFIVDSIGQDELHLGRWNHYGRALIKTKTAETIPPVLAAPAPPTTPNPSPSLGRRVALVIGNADYKNAALVNPTFDADLVSETLRRAGFEVTEFKNVDFDAMDQALTNFAKSEDRPDIVLFYFAGHGFALNDGLRQRNYLMSTSARLNSPSEGALRRDGIPLDEVIDRISAPAKITLAFIDACRNDPFHRGVGDRGFAPADSSFDRQIYIGMSTKLGKTALDGEKGTGSPFAQSFTQIIPTPGLRFDDAFRKLREVGSFSTVRTD